jgi:hypothetical protein
MASNQGEVQASLPSPIASSVGPSLAVFNFYLFAAWKGSDSDERIWFSIYQGAADNGGPGPWLSSTSGFGTAPVPVPVQAALPSPIASAVGPSLAVFNNLLYAAWRGGGNDESIWYTAYDGNLWALDAGVVQMQIPNVASTNGPSLAVYNGRLYAAWKGSGSDVKIWWSSAAVIGLNIVPGPGGFQVSGTGFSTELTVTVTYLYTVYWTTPNSPATETSNGSASFTIGRASNFEGFVSVPTMLQLNPQQRATLSVEAIDIGGVSMSTSRFWNGTQWI